MNTLQKSLVLFSLLLLSTILPGCGSGGGGGDEGGSGGGVASPLDTSFGTGGKVTTPIGASVDNIKAMVRQADGKFVVAGHALMGTDDFAVARYNANGTLDAAFGTGGTTTTDFGSIEQAYAVALQADGKVIAAGSSVISAAFALARYNTDGSLDTTFDTDGKVTTQFTGSSDQVRAVAVQTDGKIVAAGYTFSNVTSTNIALARYNTDGSLDTTFDTDGKVTTDVGGDSNEANAMVLQSDGKIVVAGYAYNGGNDDFLIARYNADGSLDGGFGAGGITTTDFNGRGERGLALAQQADGKLVVAGFSYSISETMFALARYNTDGSLDTSFGTGGKVMTNIGNLAEQGTAVALQPDGKIIVAGSSNVADSDFVLVRYNTDGSLDSGYGTAGIIRTDFSGASDQAYALVIQPDGKAVAAGQSAGNFALARYLP